MDILILVGLLFLLLGVVIPLVFIVGFIWYKKVVEPIMNWILDKLDL